MIKTDTWMPLYVSDYLADTAHLSTEEHGAYFLLLMHAWVNNGVLPDDDERLRRITRMEAKAWKASKSELRAFFYQHEGVLRHHRVDTELQRAQVLVNQRSEAGKASAAKRKAEREAQRNGNARSTVVDGTDSGNDAKNGQFFNEQTDESESVDNNKKAKENKGDNSTSVATTVEREAQRNGKPPPSHIHNTTTDVVVLPSSQQESQPQDDPTASPTRVGALCKRLRALGIDAAPHLQAWAELLPRYSDEQIIACAEATRDAKPGQRIHLNYLLPKLADAAAPKPGAKASRRQPKAENFAGIDYGDGGKL